MDFTGKVAITAYGCAAITLMILDVAWLNAVVSPIYQAELDEILRTEPSFASSVVFYLLYGVGIVVFAIMPGVDSMSLLRAGLLGGLLAYGASDLTHLATLKQSPLNLAELPIVWGTFVSAVAAVSGTAAVMAIGRRQLVPQ